MKKKMNFDYIVKFRINEDQKRHLQEKAKYHKCSESMYARNLIDVDIVRENARKRRESKPKVLQSIDLFTQKHGEMPYHDGY